jgi:amino acid permease
VVPTAMRVLGVVPTALLIAAVAALADVGAGIMSILAASIVDASIMSIPAAMRVLGVVPAALLIAAVAALADVSVEFMLRYTGWAAGGGKEAATSYAGTMGNAFGRADAALLNVFVVLTTTGTLVVYLIIIGELATSSIENEFRSNRDCDNVCTWCARVPQGT